MSGVTRKDRFKKEVIRGNKCSKVQQVRLRWFDVKREGIVRGKCQTWKSGQQVEEKKTHEVMKGLYCGRGQAGWRTHKPCIETG